MFIRVASCRSCWFGDLQHRQDDPDEQPYFFVNNVLRLDT